MKIVANLMVLVVLGFVLTGCGPTRRIIYDDSEILPMDQTLPYSINIDIMDDRSNGDSLSTLPLRLDREDVFDDTRRCLNAENEYADIVIEKINSSLVSHFKRARLFEDVGLDDDYEFSLKGKLSTFFGYQDFSWGTAIAANFGLIGALFSSGNTTPGVITIEIKNLRIVDKERKVVKKYGDFKRVYSEEYPIDAYCWYIFSHVNDALKKFNEELTEFISSN
ncbi:MAG: hypothetical protein MJZ25_07590 [Fibrobacter sp.]|nr:hypothetical protein [Fibrobacter sp.]